MNTVEQGALFTLYDAKQRLLLQQRSQNAPVFPNYWGFVGDRLQAGESPSTAVKRKAQQELGIRMLEPIFIGAVLGSTAYEPIIFHLFIEPMRYSIDHLRKRQTTDRDLGMFSAFEWLRLQIAQCDRHFLSLIHCTMDRLTARGALQLCTPT